MAKKKAQVWVYFREDESIFFLLLKTNAKRGGFWQPVTGSVDPDETVEEAALREFQEETGLALVGNVHAISEPFEFTGHGIQNVEYPFLVEVSMSDRQKVRLDPNEHVEFQWCMSQQAFEFLKYESNARVLHAAIEFLAK